MYNVTGTTIGMTHILLPFLVLPLFASMQRIDRDLLRAAAALGATPAFAFWKVFFPLSLPGLTAGALLVFVLSIGYYVTPQLLGGGSTVMIGQLIQRNIELFSSWGAASAVSMVLLAMVMAVFLLMNRFLSLDRVFERLSHETRSQLPATIGLAGAGGARRRRPCLLVLPIFIVVPMSFSASRFLSFPPPAWSLRWYAEYFGSAEWMLATLVSLQARSPPVCSPRPSGSRRPTPSIRRRRAVTEVAYPLLMMPLMMPHIIVAVGVFFLFARIGLNNTLTGHHPGAHHAGDPLRPHHHSVRACRAST